MALLAEHEIRPKELMAKQRIAGLVDLGRILSKSGEFVHVDCPACDSNQSLPKFQKNGVSYVTCQECKTFYVNPRPAPEVLDWFYKGSPNYSFWNEFIFPTTEAARLEKIFKPRVDRLLNLCLKYKLKTESLLEVGAGFGTFCAEIKSRNVFKRVIAVEPTPDLANTCRAKGVEVIENSIENIELDTHDLFDVVSSFEVIEHLFAPVDFVRHMSRLLKPGGLLMLTCPNGEGFDIQTLGVLSNSIDHEHLNYFNIKSIDYLLSRNGFEVLESFTPGMLDADLVRNKILDAEYDIENQPFLQKILIDDWAALGGPFQEFLVKHRMSSNMWVVAKKLD
jgi:SAM-dependent methyltransferase